MSKDDLYIILDLLIEPFIMIVYSNRKYLFGIVLTDHIFIEEFFYLYGFPDSELVAMCSRF